MIKRQWHGSWYVPFPVSVVNTTRDFRIHRNVYRELLCTWAIVGEAIWQRVEARWRVRVLQNVRAAVAWDLCHAASCL